MPVAGAGADARRIEKILKQLSPGDRESLFAFAEFLLARSTADKLDVQQEEQQPKGIERPTEESVIGAVKRLRENYFMVNPDTLLHETSELMQSHMLKGRPAVEVIDELERLFESKYKDYTDSMKGNAE
ncbi:hypothetical protein [Solemya elarraichensis gill symbiont]|uniref:Crp/Fnr family transcriptional regulator n=1 Tax=Solemya elarraichensis gill symbiont TaxID=1918949 RepID=A0A1T2LCV0_9GAMM|nr:hypothetical protein [Solemya elarraichensis gill symbiont]OOZ42928.1 hypothetical protein BOW52_00975 [Solemya elarraichensis gill symbiont]